MYHRFSPHVRSNAPIITLICTLLLSSVLLLGVTFAQETGQIDVQVEGYDGSAVMTAHLIDSSFRYLENKTINTASFSFSGVPLNQEYFILLYYNGVPYTHQLNVNQSLTQVSIRVFEMTASDEDVLVAFHHVAISRTENSLNVTEFIQFANIGDQVQNGTEIKIAMPQGFKNFRSSHSCCVQRTDFGFFFTLPEPLFPNQTQTIDLRYELSPDADEYEFEKRAYYDTVFTVVTVAAEDLQVVSADNLQSEGPIDINQRTFEAFSIPDIFAGQGFSITVTGYRTAELNLLWVGTGVLLVLIVGAIVFGFRGTKVSIDRLQAEEEALSSVMTELEKDFGEGKIKEVDYLKMKLKYTSRLEKVQSRIQEYTRVKGKS